jgi:hypothetical protein
MGELFYGFIVLGKLGVLSVSPIELAWASEPFDESFSEAFLCFYCFRCCGGWLCFN